MMRVTQDEEASVAERTDLDDKAGEQAPLRRPRWEELPLVPDSQARSAWGVFGDDDELGGVNLVSADCAVQAAALVRTGRSFRLDLPLEYPSPPIFTREPFRHEVFDIAGTSFLDDRIDNLFPQSSTQWDALSHGYLRDAGFYNGFSRDQVFAGKLGIHNIAERGVVTRGVLADVARHRADAGNPVNPEAGDVITPEELQATLDGHGVRLQSGDVLCVRTGWMQWYLGLDEAGREKVSEKSRTFEGFALPGLGPGPEIAELMWDSGVAMLAADTPMVEPWPTAARPDGSPAQPAEMLHMLMLVLLGIPLGEFFDFEALADDCARDGRYDFLFTSAPLRLHGGIGSPPNVLAVK